MKTLFTNKILYLIIIIIALFSIVFKILLKSNSGDNALLDKYQLRGLSVEEMVLRLDEITNESRGFRAYITGSKFVISEGDLSLEYDTPKGKFYVSFAPYINNSHTCEIHSLSGCRGELINQLFDLEIIENDGSIIYSGKVMSMDNGFIGIWLPKNIEANVIIKYKELITETNIRTFDSSNTCITTPIRLKPLS